MSKHSTETVEPNRRQKASSRHENKIPDLEYLFRGDGTKEENADKSKGFLFKLLRKDWLGILFSTFLYILQASPLWLMPVVTSDVIDMITYKPDGFVTRIIIDGLDLLSFFSFFPLLSTYMLVLFSLLYSTLGTLL